MADTSAKCGYDLLIYKIAAIRSKNEGYTHAEFETFPSTPRLGTGRGFSHFGDRSSPAPSQDRRSQTAMSSACGRVSTLRPMK